MFLMDVYSKHRGKEFYLVCFYSLGFDRKWKGLLGLFIIFWTTTTFEHEPGWFMIAVNTPENSPAACGIPLQTAMSRGDRTNMATEQTCLWKVFFFVHMIYEYICYIIHDIWYYTLDIQYIIQSYIMSCTNELCLNCPFILREAPWYGSKHGYRIVPKVHFLRIACSLLKMAIQCVVHHIFQTPRYQVLIR